MCFGVKSVYLKYLSNNNNRRVYNAVHTLVWMNYLMILTQVDITLGQKNNLTKKAFASQKYLQRVDAVAYKNIYLPLPTLRYL